MGDRLDGYRQESLKLHQDSGIHKEHAKAANFSSVEKQEAVCKRPTPKTELLSKWRTTLPRQTVNAILNKIRGAKFLAREKIAGQNFGATMSLLKECGLVAGNTHRNYEGYKHF